MLEADVEVVVEALNQLDKKHLELVGKLQRDTALGTPRSEKPRLVLEGLLSGKIDSMDIDCGGLFHVAENEDVEWSAEDLK
eukprot:9468010-Pyramimonas_sp.AAC.1